MKLLYVQCACAIVDLCNGFKKYTYECTQPTTKTHSHSTCMHSQKFFAFSSEHCKLTVCTTLYVSLCACIHICTD